MLELNQNRWISKALPLTPKQAAFLSLTCREALYGGAAGGGKSVALLAGALHHVDHPGYSALLVRRTYEDLSRSGALIPLSHEWLRGTAAKWNEQKHSWTFPSGATLAFGYLEHANDMYRYQGAAYQYIGFDELTQLGERGYKYLALSRQRRLVGSEIPIRTRAASNPGGDGHDWVHQRFMVEGAAAGRVFLPAKLGENPHLDRADYEASMQGLDPITRAQLLNGDWSARQAGGWFPREKFQLIDPNEVEDGEDVRWWDMAASVPKANSDPDYTVGLKLRKHGDGTFTVLHVERFRLVPGDTEKRIRQIADLDGRGCPIWMEQEPGSSGVIAIDHYLRGPLSGHDFHGERSTGDKEERARPLAAAVDGGLVRVVRDTWTSAFVDEMDAFPYGGHDDQVDALSGAFNKLTTDNFMAWIG